MFFWRDNTEKQSKLGYYSPKGVKSDFCQFPNFSKIDEKSVAQLGICGSTSWTLSLEKKDAKVTVGLHCQPKNPFIAGSDKWSVEGDVIVRLLNQNNGKPVMLNAPGIKFNRKEGKESHWSHVFDDVINNKNGFVKDDTVVFHVQVGIKDIEALYSGQFIDFSFPRAKETDSILLVNGAKFHVSKQILSLQSPVFDTMFNGQFAETEMREIAIQDVDLVSFHLLLQYMYMAPISVCVENVAEMLEMADRFLVKRLMRECENFLMNCEMEEEEVIELGCMFSLEKLLCHKISQKTGLGDLLTTFPLVSNLPPTASMYLSVRISDFTPLDPSAPTSQKPQEEPLPPALEVVQEPPPAADDDSSDESSDETDDSDDE